MGETRKYGGLKKGIWLALFLGCQLFSCNKHDLPENLKGTLWELDGYVTANGSWKPNEIYNEIRFEFLDTMGIRILLPVNDCGADLIVFTGNRIQLGSMVCTEICCDPEYAEDLKVVLSQVVSYYVEKKKLYLQGPRGSAILTK